MCRVNLWKSERQKLAKNYISQPTESTYVAYSDMPYGEKHISRLRLECYKRVRDVRQMGVGIVARIQGFGGCSDVHP